MIQLNDTGPLVGAWQLICRAFPIDRKFGKGTARGVEAWQLDRGIEPDGVIGPVTRAALQPGDMIKGSEGLRLWTYDDKTGLRLRWLGGTWRSGWRPGLSEESLLALPTVRGYPTIGWGRRLYNERIETCTREQADAWFAADIAATRLPAVKRAGLSEPGQVAAACSFAYNCGTGALANLSVLGFSKVAWLSYHRSKGVEVVGLLARREEEFALFADGDDIG